MLVVVWIWLQFPWQRKNVTFGYVQQGRNRPYEVFPWAFMRCVCGKLGEIATGGTGMCYQETLAYQKRETACSSTYRSRTQVLTDPIVHLRPRPPEDADLEVRFLTSDSVQIDKVTQNSRIAVIDCHASSTS
jgi:hypothetical protein